MVVSDPAARAAATAMMAAIGLDAGRLEAGMGKRRTDMETGSFPGLRRSPGGSAPLCIVEVGVCAVHH